jgi:ketosteroid isomerase-like protein
MNHEEEIAAQIIAMERAALDKWGRGDPSGFLEISDPDVVYFDPFLEKRLDGLKALTAYYEGAQGKIHIDHDQLINPRVQVNGEVAILTYNYISYAGETKTRWNCTEVYRRKTGQWRIIQTHWSLTQPLN